MAENQLPEFDPNPPQQPADAPAPQLPTTGNASQAPPQTTAQREVKRRNRRPVVCMPCRERRSKCSREKPCTLCAKRGEAHLCVYAEPIDKSGAQAASRSARTAASRAKQLEQLGQLESLFKKYLSSDATNAQPDAKGQPYGYGYGGQQPTPATTDQDAPPQDSLDASTLPHWSSLFRQLRSTLEGYEDAMSDVGDGVITSEEAPILLGSGAPTSLGSIIRQYLPQDQGEVSNRLNTYFSSPYMVIPVIHSGKFLDEYEAFWAVPAETADPIWVALLFAILSLSAHISASQGNEADVAHHEAWIGACSQCLSVGGYTKPRPYLIPAMLMLAQSQYMRYLDPSREVSLIISIVARLAFQSGLHREPGVMVSPFEAEMRRRLWVMIRHFDCQIACQFGVPPSVQFDAADIEAPRNLYDNDFHETIDELPPSRPESELTPTNSFLLKNRFMTLFSQIYSHALSASPSTMDDAEVEKFETALQTQRSQMPANYKPKPISLSLGDVDTLRMSRLTIDLLYHKSLIILHRRRMSKLSSSRATCLSSACAIINSFGDFVAELRPGKLMAGKAWMLSATVVNDFLLATMTLCAALLNNHSSPTSPRKQSLDRDRETHLNTVETARAICTDLSPRSRGAGRVLAAINSLLVRFGRDQPMDPRLTGGNPPPQPTLGYEQAQPYSMMPMPGSTQTQDRAPNIQQPYGAVFGQTPSSALSQERSTSGVSNGQAPAPWLYNDPNAPTPVMAGVFPSTRQQDSQQNHASVGLFVAQGQQGQQGQFIADNGAGDVFSRVAVGGGPSSEIDWSAFDQYITEF